MKKKGMRQMVGLRRRDVLDRIRRPGAGGRHGECDVDGTLFGQNPGVHALSNVNFTSPTLAAGNHQIEVLFADRQHVGAALSVNLLSSGVVIWPPSAPVPEPGTLALLASGMTGLVFARRRKAGRARG
jgi:hypothetical protein